MQLNLLKRKNSLTKSKYIGRGGKRGTTSGRGTKGQKARAGRKLRPELRDIIKKLPKLRGRGKNINTSIQTKSTAVTTDALERVFASGDSVSPTTLLAKGLVKKQGTTKPRIKILAGKALGKKLTVTGCEVSAAARALVEKAGGQVA